MEPTILNNVTWEDKVMQEKIFGPPLPVMAYEDLDDVIAHIKQRPKPLSPYLSTQNEGVKNKVLREVSFRGGCINEAVMHMANGELPFGGVGDSGVGHYHGEAGFRAFSLPTQPSTSAESVALEGLRSSSSYARPNRNLGVLEAKNCALRYCTELVTYVITRLTVLSTYVFAVWSLTATIGLTNAFPWSAGPLSNWLVWLALAVLLNLLASNFHGRQYSLSSNGRLILNSSCITGSERTEIEPNKKRVRAHLDDCLMLVTALNPDIGYEKAAKISVTARHCYGGDRPASKRSMVAPCSWMRSAICPWSCSRRYPRVLQEHE